MNSVIIPARFKGPPNSANGGYVCGLMARRLAGDVAASLKMPPPLDTPIQLVERDGVVAMHLGDQLLGQAQEARLDLDAPEFPEAWQSDGDPVAARGRPREFTPFSTCFVCGKGREFPDGLCIHPQRVRGHEGMVAAQWRLHPDLADASGCVAPEYLWGALDCPGYFACAPGEAALLARLTARICAPLPPEGEALVIGWDLHGRGRKRRCGTAVYAPDGTLVAKAEGLWVVVDPASLTA